MRVPAAGGTASVFGTLSQGAVTQRWPQALPGGTSVLYTEHSSIANFDGANLVIAPLSGGTPKVVVRGGYYGRFVPSGRASTTRGHVIYMNQGTLFAVPFDLDRLETIGPAVPALDRVAMNSGTGRCAAGRVLGRHAGVRARRGRDDGQRHRLDHAGRQDVGAPRGEGRLEESAVLARRPEAGDRHLRRKAARHLGV